MVQYLQFRILEFPLNYRAEVEEYEGTVIYLLCCSIIMFSSERYEKILYFEWSPPWHLYVLLLANLLAFSLTYLLAFYLAFYLAYLLAYLLAFYLAYLLAFYLTLYLAYLLTFYLAFEVQRCALNSEGPRLRSSGAHWARQVPGWGPAVPTALRTLQLRSSRAHSDRKPAVEVQQCPLRAEVGEEIGDELARQKWTWKLMQTWSRRNREEEEEKEENSSDKI